jgi:nitrogenase molybdenum-iron protein alpha chain
VIEVEVRELREALEPFRETFEGKKVFVSAGEFRALATANLFAELGFEISGIRSFHHDEFAEVEYEKLEKIAKSRGKDFVVDIANVQPFEEANLLLKIRPDFFLGHIAGNSTAAKLGIGTHTIYNVNLAYVGYRGVYELARRAYRQLKNPAFNRNLARQVRLPYTQKWTQADPFRHIQENSAHG